MSYVVFARKWRPASFEEVIGQEHITTTLKNAILNKRVAHAYIFTGPRGIGKTSVARIFAKGLNCEKGPTPSPCNKCASCNDVSSSISMDVIEIDGASNNSVDQIRELRESIKFAPSYAGYKIYIIDEVHMLSIGAFNALLKTLEEPPKHAKFIFATTNPERIPSTVLSRCQRFDFRRIPFKLIISKLKRIAESEKLKVSDEAIFSVARASDGSMRDAESILDQLSSFCEKDIGQENVITLLGTIRDDKLADIVKKLSEKDTAGLLKSIDELIFTGKDISQFLTGLMGYIRNLMILKVSPDLAALIDLPDSHINNLKEQSKDFRIEELLYIFYTLSATANAIKRSGVSRFITEASFIKLSLRNEIMSLPEIMEKIACLESNVGRYSPPLYKREESTKPEAQDPKPEARSAEPGARSAEPETRRSSAGAEEIKNAWPGIIDAIKGKKISIASYLAEGEIVKVQGSLITLGFAAEFNLHKEVLEETANRKFIEEIASGILEQGVKLEFITVEKTETPSGMTGGSSKFDVIEEELEREAAEGATDDSIIKSAIEIFGGKIVKGRGKDPER